MRYFSNDFEIMSYEEFKFLVGGVELLVAVFFCHYFSLQTVLVKVCLLLRSCATVANTL